MQAVLAAVALPASDFGPIFVGGLAFLALYAICRALYLRHLRESGGHASTLTEAIADSIALAVVLVSFLVDQMIFHHRTTRLVDVLFVAVVCLVMVIVFYAGYQRGRSPWRPWWSYPRRPPAES